jgi:hypothetical protein
MRFVDAGTEERYRLWQIESSVPFNRLGCYLSIANWASAITVVLVVGTPGAFAFMALGALVVSIIVLALMASHGRLPLWLMQPTTAVANFVAGVVLVGYTNWLVVVGPQYFSFDLTVPVAMLVNYYGFAILRLRPRLAMVSILPYVLLEAAFAFLNVDAGRASPAALPFQLLMLGSGLVTGVMINVALDITSRRTFRQERIIEAQETTIALERRRSEAMLQQELRHQVAERSRELGRMLAREDAATAFVDLSPGTQFNARYNIVRPLGAGGMGTVYEVVRVTDGQSLALKIVTGAHSRTSAVRFAREAEIGARVKHRNLVSIVDVGVASNGVPFLVMDLVTGASLEEHRNRFGDAAWALPILIQIASGIAALHECGIVHRDLKPANVLLSGDHGAPLARISDFGISRFDQTLDGEAHTLAALTGTGALLGTPLYMAPEMAHGGRVDSAADVFAFGIVAYEVLTGRLPFATPPVLLTIAVQELPVPAPMDDPADSVVRACLARAPIDRPSIEEVLAELQRLGSKRAIVGTRE